MFSGVAAELAGKYVYRRGEGLIIILIYPKLLFRFTYTKEGEVEDLENISCIRGNTVICETTYRTIASR
jgi:hypothetical protein